MNKNTRKNNEKNYKNITKYPYLLTTYNRNDNNRKLNVRNNKSYGNSRNKLKITINTNNTFSLFNPDEEYVTKLNFFNIGTNRIDTKKRVSLYNLNIVPKFPNILKKDSTNSESYKEKKRILNELSSKKIAYDKENNNESSKQTYVNRYENSVKENKLEKERKEIEKKIYKLKEMIKVLSNELSMNIKEIDNLKLDIDIMKNYHSLNILGNLTDRKINNKNKEEGGTQSIRRKSVIKERRGSTRVDKSKEKENKFKLEMMLIAKSEKVNKLKEETKIKINELEVKKKELLEKIETCEYELKKFKDIHHNLKDELLVHYHKLLSEGKDTRKEGLSWIILAIWNLKSNVLLSYLPKFLDQNIILFLFEYSSLLKKIKETESNLHELAIKLKEHKENIKNNNRREDLQNIIFNNNGKFQNMIIDKVNSKSSISSESNEKSEKSSEEEDINEEKEDLSSEKDKEESRNENNKNNELIKEEENENENKETNVNKLNSSRLEEGNDNERNEEKKENNKEENNGENGDENDVYDSMKEEKKDYKQQTKFIETFKTSLYNTNSEQFDNNNNALFEKDNFIKKKENNFIKNKEFKGKKEKQYTINMPTNFIKSLFRKENLYKKNPNNEDKEVKIKLCDFKNIYNRRQSYVVDIKTFQLFNEHKKLEDYYLRLKEKADLLMKNELDRVNKSFYLHDYGGRYNIDQKTVISALVGEDSVRAELIKQKKEEKEYFKTLRELRKGKTFQKK